MPSASEMERQYQDSQDTHGASVDNEFYDWAKRRAGLAEHRTHVLGTFEDSPNNGWMIIACVITLVFIAGICVGLTLGALING